MSLETVLKPLILLPRLHLIQWTYIVNISESIMKISLLLNEFQGTNNISPHDKVTVIKIKQ